MHFKSDRMPKTLRFFIWLPFLISVSTMGQNLLSAMKKLEAGKTKEAQDLAYKALKSNPGDSKVLHFLGNLYKKTGNYALAEVFLAQAVEKSPVPDDQLWFDLAENEQMAGQFQDALEGFSQISSRFKGIKLVEKRKIQCQAAAELMANPVEVQIKNLGKPINSPGHECRPLLSSDEMQLFFTYCEESEFQPFNPENKKIFQSLQKGFWEKPQLVSPPGGSGEGEMATCISPDGARLGLVRQGKSTDLFTTEFKDKRWSKPMPLPFNSPVSETSVCFSVDGKRAWFVSNRRGNKDIFSTIKNERGQWSVPKPLSGKINTREDEECPWVDAEGKYLYFSSKGYPGMGGFDIFKIALDDPSATPQNLGFPINSPVDDLFFMLMPDGKVGYYSSQRSGGLGGSDIYQIQFGKSKNRQVALFKGTISDFSGLPVDAQITITDMETKQQVARLKAHPETGTFVSLLNRGKSYSILMEKEGYLFYSDFINLEDETGPGDQVRDIRMQKLQPGVTIILNNIFFDPGKSSLKKESSQELQRILMILRQNPGMVAEISSHLEPGGPEDDGNLKLSENRAQAIVDYLVATGIKSSRLVAKGYGSTKPLTDASNGSHRRCEIKILSSQ